MSNLLNTNPELLNEDITCPYCGYEYQDSWEIAEFHQDEEILCHDCKKPFYFQKVIVTSYRSCKVPNELELGEEPPSEGLLINKLA